MQESTYYGGYPLVRSKALTAGSTNGSVSTGKLKPTEVTGLSRMNFSACNTDWMPSLMTSAAEARKVVAPVCAVPSAAPSSDNQTRTKILQALLGKRNFYRGIPLRVSSSSSVTTSLTHAPSTNATIATKVSSVSTVSHERVSSMSARDKEVKKLPKIPLPIGSDTWTAFTDTVRTAKSAVVATRHTIKRPVAPMAVGVTEADLETVGFDSTRRGPEPLFRDLFAGSFQIEKPSYTEFVYNNMNSNMLKEPMTVDGFVTLQRVQQQQQAQYHPVPPAPISMSPLMSPHTEDVVEPLENMQFQQKPADVPQKYSDEGHYVSRALLDEINMVSVSRSPSPKYSQQESGNSMQLSGAKNNGVFYSFQQGSLLKDNEEEVQLFDDDEDAAERLRRAINIVMSLSVPENTSTVDTDVSGETKMSLELDMEWLSALGSSQQQSSLFYGF